MKLRVSLAIALVASMCVGCDDTHHARISQGAGLGEGSPVMVSGVRVGQVEGVTVIEGQVDVELSISSDHQVTLRQDACALATAAGGEPALVLLPGTGAPREGDAVIAECALPGADLGEAMRGIGEEPRGRAPARTRSSGYQRQTVTETIMKQVGRTVASTVTNAIVRGILGSLKRGR